MKTETVAKNGLRWLGLVVAACMMANAATPTVTTVAGGYIGDGRLATSAGLARPNGVARDLHGNLYISDTYNCRIRKVDGQGTISTFAGTGICGYSGDGGPAKSAELSGPYGIALDRLDNLFVTDGGRIRKITAGGTISTVVGNGTFGYSGDGGPATQASVSGPLGVFVDSRGRIYLADTGNNVIRRVDVLGIIHTIAGNHKQGFSGDGGAATSASLNFPWDVVADGQGNFYFSDINNYRVRKVDTTGTINTYAGNGSFGDTGSGGPATSAAIGAPAGLLLSAGKLYLSTGLIWAVDLSTQIINITAGNGSSGFNGDGNTALATSFSQPDGMAFDGSGGMYVADSANNRLRHIDSKQIVITTAGGNVGDGGRATQADLNCYYNFAHLAYDLGGNLYIVDIADSRVRKVSAGGAMSTIAGTGMVGYSGDGGPATAATLSFPQAVAVDNTGIVYIADSGNQVIRKIDNSGTITTFVKFYQTSNSSETAHAVALAADQLGNLYASDGVSTVWKISPTGSTTLVAGVQGSVGYNGDGIAATQAWLNFPTGVAVDNSGNVYISDWLNNRVRKVDSSGIISTVAGNGNPGFGGDGGPATSAMLFLPSDVAVDMKGNFYIADWINFRVRVVNAAGTINTLVGSGGFGYNGDGLAATQTNVFPTGVTVAPSGTVYFADQSSYRVRKVH